MHESMIQTELHGGLARRTAVLRLNRPKQFNALSDALMDELGAALLTADADDIVGCIVITGSEKAFAAGADISAMAKMTLKDTYGGDFITRNWETIRCIRKPVIAAVSGFALGGGCELAMMCDFIIAADTAKFGHAQAASAPDAFGQMSPRSRPWAAIAAGSAPATARMVPSSASSPITA